MNGGCNTCKHSWGEENCKGCLWDGKSRTNTNWEPKMKVLDKIRAEIIDTGAYEQETKGQTEFLRGINYCLSIIDEYMAESEDKEEINPYEKCRTCGQNRESCCGCPEVLELEQKIRRTRNADITN